MKTPREDLGLDVVARALHRLFIGVDDARLRLEDEKKARELAPLLAEAARVLPKKARGELRIVDAACGKSALGLLVAELLLVPRGLSARVTLVERNPRILARAKDAATRAHLPGVDISFFEGDVGDAAAWPEAPDVVLALHACGGASDVVIDRSVAHRARHLLIVPCCYGAHPEARPDDRSPPGQHAAHAWHAAVGVPSHGLIGRRFASALIDQERVLRLERAGYETHAIEAFAPTVSPYNLLLRARLVDEAVRRHAAEQKHRKLLSGPRDGGAPRPL